MRAGIKHLPLEDRSIAGRMISEAMDRVKVMYEEVLKKCKDREMAAALQKEAIDMTSLEPSRPLGGRHPLGSLMEDLVAFLHLSDGKPYRGLRLTTLGTILMALISQKIIPREPCKIRFCRWRRR